MYLFASALPFTSRFSFPDALFRFRDLIRCLLPPAFVLRARRTPEVLERVVEARHTFCAAGVC